MNAGVARACRTTVLIFITTCLFSVVLTAQNTQAANKTEVIESRRSQLLALFDEEWQYELRSNPEMATSIGD